jgi:hypothetical protein
LPVAPRSPCMSLCIYVPCMHAHGLSLSPHSRGTDVFCQNEDNWTFILATICRHPLTCRPAWARGGVNDCSICAHSQLRGSSSSK